jgi:hypothetical protein
MINLKAKQPESLKALRLFNLNCFLNCFQSPYRKKLLISQSTKKVTKAAKDSSGSEI